jgi:hypothetical protein
MGVWREIFEGFSEGFFSAAITQSQAMPQNSEGCEDGRIERLCDELGWSIDARDEGGIYLHFKTSQGVRAIAVAKGDAAIVTFHTASSATIRARDVPPEILVYLLRRNMGDGGLGMWSMSVDENKEVEFHLFYQPFGDGLTSEALKFICESMLKERLDFDAKLREAGLLR